MFEQSCISCKFHQNGFCDHEKSQTKQRDGSYKLRRTINMRRGSFKGLIKGRCGRDAKLRELK